jgi:hypothetical protein
MAMRVVADTHPDSVRRVKPPKTTMPNTLAALPSSQYATLLELVSGQLLAFGTAALAAPTSCAACPSNGVALLRNGCVDFHLTDCRSEGWRGQARAPAGKARRGELTQGRFTKSRRERRGAAVRSCGSAWNMEAMATMLGDRRYKDMSILRTFWWFDDPEKAAVGGWALSRQTPNGRLGRADFLHHGNHVQ